MTCDIRQRGVGRGFYVCPKRSCIRLTLKKRRFLRHFPHVVVPEFADVIARVQEEVLWCIATGDKKTLATPPSDAIGHAVRLRGRYVQEALQHYISLSSEGVVHNDQN